MSQDCIESLDESCANINGLNCKNVKRFTIRKNKLDWKINRMLKRATQTLAFALGLGCSISTASASVTYQINNGGLDSFNVTINGTSINGALAGGILINQVSSTDASMPSSYVTVCTDIGGTLYLGRSYEYNTPVTPFSGQSGINPTWGDGST